MVKTLTAEKRPPKQKARAAALPRRREADEFEADTQEDRSVAALAEKRRQIEATVSRPTPQSLDEIQQRRQPPPGKTAMQMIHGQWPGDETTEELLAQLKALG